MRQVVQRPRSGEIVVRNVPAPQLRSGWVLVENRFSLISAGTERTKVEFGQKSLLAKARSRPDLARKVVERARADGVRTALAAARDRLEALEPLGYSSAGLVIEVGSSVQGLAPGDSVACAGAGWANHAERVAVPANLVARVPEDVDLADAAYATLGAIALHAARQAGAQVGERIGVIGLGVVGQLAVRVLGAAGCRAVGIDLDPAAVELARAGGVTAFQRNAANLERSIQDETDGLGLDAVLVCASAPSPDPLELAARLARDRGRLVVVGNVPVAAERSLLYEKELEISLARSYGPGRYDRDYEERGRDLPPGYVRWTEGRNLSAFLDLLAAGRLDVAALTTHRFSVEQAADAYALLSRSPGAERPFGILLEYEPNGASRTAAPRRRRASASRVRVGVIGTGSFARTTLLPALRDLGADVAAVASEAGLSAADSAARIGGSRAATADEILADDDIGAVVVATRHTTHAELASRALRAGKAVFVEKPLALTEAELCEVEAALAEAGLLFVGFNRRFAPLVVRLCDELRGTASKALLARVNAGPLPHDHWLNDLEEGGGRLAGEGCHLVDLLAHLAGSALTAVHAVAAPDPGAPLECSQSVAATLRFADGSVASLVYAGNGDRRPAKERIEAFAGGLSAVLDDFRRLELYRGGHRTTIRARRDKGHRAEIERFLGAASGEAELPAADSFIQSTRATLAIAESLRTGREVWL